jgi:PAS domain S-box-containing protein
MMFSQAIIIFLLGTLFGSTIILIAVYIKRRATLNESISAAEIITQLPEHVYWKNKDGVILGSNDLNARHAGLECAADMIGKTDYDLFIKEEAESFRANDLEVISTGLPKIVEERGIRSSLIYLSYKIPLRDRNNKIAGILGISVDVTDARKKEMERLKFLENIIALMPEHIFWKNKEGVLLGSNDMNARNAGLKCAADMVGKTDYDLFPQEDADRLRANDQEIMHAGLAKVVEEPRVLPNGSTALFLSHKIPLQDHNNQIIGLLGVSFDITEKKRTEEKLEETQAKLDGMTLISAGIAHELRTPIRAIKSSAGSLKRYLPELLEGYKLAREAKLPVSYINPIHRNALEDNFDVIESEAQLAFTVIEMLLVRLNKTDKGLQELSVCSISGCIEEALKRYPFDTDELEKVHWARDQDFLFKGNELMMVHVLFNLFKNAFHHIKAVNKGNIQCWVTQQQDMNQLHFKDTGQGIAANALPHIFDQFFSKTTHGTGIGLSFCKRVMHGFGGDIICHSVEGEYTEFVLSFPIDSTLTE